ncbi:hypothetical protein K2173_008618 [Erythroxylum novogranatense]|uniref:Protein DETOXIFICATION n=1 Tax=Erythroxylum novogranatense TaxID=1862640 RepID=A0AAV8SLQ6_9ROSI|nr:hypothetical protein K2173_008618 [Erythroxylum novogranatense]
METTPLLTGAHSALKDYEPVKSFKEAKSVFCVESLKMWRIAAPIAFNMLCQFGVNSVTNIFVGHIGDYELSAVAISLSVIGTFSFGFMLGMGSALETLCGQAFGAGQVHMLGVYMQRSFIVLTTFCFILLPIYVFASPILKLLGQDDDVADLAGWFTLLTIPQLFSLAFNFPSSKFLQAQSKVGVLTWIGIVVFLLHILMLWVFIYTLRLNLVGAAIAYNISSWALAIAQVVYCVGWCKDAWHGLSWAAFKDIWAFVRLSFASAVMLCLEIWYMMSLTILTGHLDNAVLAVDSLSICMNFNGWEGMLFIGINVAISVRVSNELGLGRPRATKYSVYVTVLQCLVIGLLFMVIIMVAREHFPVIFTNSKILQKTVSKYAYILGVTMVLNSVQPVISGVAVGAGWQALVAYINVGCYYIFGLPLGFLLGYRAKLGFMGLWGGMLGGTLLQTLLLLFVLYKTNWNSEVAQTSERMRKWGGQDPNIEKVDNGA